MKLHIRVLALLVVLLAPASAAADDWSGFGLVLGIPVLLVSGFFYGLLAALGRLNGAVYAIATLLFVPLVIFVSSVRKDALDSLVRDDHATNESAYWFFGLSGFVLICFLIMTWRYWRQNISLPPSKP
jgi:O-antigen/teichoic acid export membrane protein